MEENISKLTYDHINILTDFYDIDNTGYVNMDEFLIGLRGLMSEERLKICEKAFLKIDKDCEGVLKIK